MIELNIENKHVRHVEKMRGSVGNRGHNDGNENEQRSGLIGETVVCDWLDKPWPLNLGRHDGLYDFKYSGYKCDVKTTATPAIDGDIPNWWRFPVIEDQIDYPVDFYLFVVNFHSCGVIVVAGCIWKTDFLETSNHVKRGDKWPNGAPVAKANYYVNLRHLYEIHMKSDIDRFVKILNMAADL